MGCVSDAIRKNFASDNVAPICPEILAAMVAANEGAVSSYGADALSAALDARFGALFGAEVAAFPVATGTAANSLALSALVQPFGSVLCDYSAHINADEGGAPEFFTGGAKLVGLPTPDGLMELDSVAAAWEVNVRRGTMSPPFQALSITQTNEWGLTYDVPRVAALAALAHERGAGVHMDGARLGNALAHLGVSPAEATWKAGVDVLTFGGTKAGAMAAEAVIFFLNDRTRAPAAAFARRLKRSGHVWSKQRFVSAQLLALIDGDLWLRNGARANATAARLAEGLRRHAGAYLVHEVQGNEVFVVLPDKLLRDLEEAGWGFHRRVTPEGVSGTLIRLVTSWYTREEDVDAFLADVSA